MLLEFKCSLFLRCLIVKFYSASSNDHRINLLLCSFTLFNHTIGVSSIINKKCFISKYDLKFLIESTIAKQSFSTPSSKGSATERPWEGDREGRGRPTDRQMSSPFRKTGR